MKQFFHKHLQAVLTVGLIIVFVLSIFAAFAKPANAGWFDPPPASSDKQMAQKAEQQNKQIDAMVGYPSILNGFEKRQVRMLYELRDNPEYRTWSYIVTMSGKFVFICDSIGYGINASIQFSNPEKVIDAGDSYGNGYGYLPQAEPNGLYMPEGLAATYVMCLDGEEVKPVYVESEVLVSPFEMVNE